jgi:phosphoribosylglycinamide formyltransferase-1
VEPEYDSGPIIFQKAVPVLEGDTPEELQKRVMEQAEWQLLPEAIRLFSEGKLNIEGRHVRILE